MPLRPALARVSSPPAVRGHKVEEARPSPPPHFARLNQDCVDIIVEYAAGSVEAVLQLRCLSKAFGLGVANLFALVYRGRPAPVTRAGFDAYEPQWITAYFGRLDPAHPLSWDVATLVLVALYRGGGPTSVTALNLSISAGREREAVDECIELYARSFPNTIAAIEALDSPDVTDASLRAIAAHCPNLRSLHLSDACGITGFGARDLLEACTRLECLSLAGACDSAAGVAAVVDALGDRCTADSRCRLKHLTLTQHIYDDGAAWRRAILRGFGGSLESIALSAWAGAPGCASDGMVIAIAEHCPRLTSIRVDGNKCVTDASCVAVALKLPRLREIDLGGTAVTDTGIGTIARHCGDLETVGLGATTSVTGESLSVLASHCPRLTCLTLTGAQGFFSVHSFRVVITSCTRLAAVRLQRCRGLNFTAEERALLRDARPGCAFDFGDGEKCRS